MKKIIIAFILGIMVAYWSAHNFVDFALDGMQGCETNSWLTVSELCVWGRNPFGRGPWTLWFSYNLPIKF